MNQEAIRNAQRMMKTAGYYQGPISGVLGPLTKHTAQLILERHNIAFRPWPDSRQLVAAEQALLNDLGFAAGPVDGLVGPQTMFARESYEHFARTGQMPQAWRPDGLGDLDSPPAPPEATQWPRHVYAKMVRFYGNVGENQARVQLPFRMRIAWDLGQSVSSFLCHERVHDSMLWCFEAIAHQYSERQRASLGLDLFGGCLNVRQVRGGSTWSTHSWGIAIDFDPLRNQLRWGRDRARLAGVDAEPFRRIMREAGAISLGEARNYDWMHFQFARL